MARRMGRGKCRQLTYSINLSFPWISLVCHSVYGEKWRCLNFSRKWNTDCSELKRGKPRMSSRSIWQLPVVEMRGSFSFLSLTSLLTLFWNWLQQFLSPGISHRLTNLLNINHFPPPATTPYFTPLQHKSEYLLMFKVSTSLVLVG